MFVVCYPDGMVRFLYKRILKKIDLSQEQLAELSQKLTPENICAGPFLKDGKMCPNTTALGLKAGKNFSDTREIRTLFKQYGIGKFELAVFYLFFDIPALLSKRLFEKSLESLRAAAKQLM